MHEGPPAFVVDPPRLVGEVQRCGDADVQPELCAKHLRIGISAAWCDDVEWAFEQRESLHSLDALVAWCRTLATADDHTIHHEAWGRVQRQTFSLDSHTSTVEPDPARRRVWFYPMTEDRLCLGVEVGPSIVALRSCLTWAREHLDVVDADVRASIASGIATSLALLDAAERRLALPSR